MEAERTAASEKTIKALLEISHRSFVPIRRGLVCAARKPEANRTPSAAAPRPPLAQMVRHRDVRALDFYLLILAKASAGEFDVTLHAAVWARALDVWGKSKDAAVSKTLAHLVGYKLVARDRRGRLAHVMLCREDGSGDPYTRPGQPGDGYLKLSHRYWEDRWHTELSLPGKAALLVSLSMPADFFLTLEHAPRLFGIAADTLDDGVRELCDFHLLERTLHYEDAPLSPTGRRRQDRYRLLPPFEKQPQTRPHSSTAEGT